ncbi:MAG TPA: S8 family serine peptidase, partial [Trichocoleus sp.]
LLGNIWVNDGEVAGDGIDNDNNGYIDDLHGWNFGINQNNSDVTPGSKSFGQDHGTHVAGTIAAKNNGIGMTGVAPDAKIMAIRMGNVVDGFFTNAGSLAQAITYAVDNGAKVVNMSLGWTDSGDLRDALAYAASKNVITVSAAGNDGRLSPASVPGKYATNYGLTVGAVDIDQEIASFSNLAGANSKMQYVVAPGVEIYSTLPGNRYGFQQGTSMASPHVAGVVALMLSANPNLTHDQVRAILTETGLDLAGQISSQGPIAGSGSGSRLTSPLDTGSAAAALGPKPESEVDYALTDAVLADLEASTAFGAGVSTWGKSRINPPDSISSEESADSGVFLVAELATSVFEKLTVADLGISSEADLANTSSFSLEQDWVAQEFTEFVLS